MDFRSQTHSRQCVGSSNYNRKKITIGEGEKRSKKWKSWPTGHFAILHSLSHKKLHLFALLMSQLHMSNLVTCYLLPYCVCSSIYLAIVNKLLYILLANVSLVHLNFINFSLHTREMKKRRRVTHADTLNWSIDWWLLYPFNPVRS